MNKQILTALLISFLLGATGCAVEAGYVSSPPSEVVYTRPIAPGPDYVWIGGDWVWSGGRYTWREGHWGRRRGGRDWQSGRWQQTPKGYRWQKGGWR